MKKEKALFCKPDVLWNNFPKPGIDMVDFL